MKVLGALVAGLVFGVGLVVAQMTNPAKVLAFLDITGDWDPSLGLVMAGAVIVTSIGYRLVLLRDKPLAASTFDLPTNRSIDSRLAAGAVLFGAGWGLVGLCPGPAIAAVSLGGIPSLTFLGAMLAGVMLHDFGKRR